MFSQIKTIVDLITCGAMDLSNLKSKLKRQNAVLELLRVYFLLKDCVDDGEELLSEANPNPVEKIASMEPGEAASTVKKWHKTLRKQGIRLSMLQKAIVGQDHIAVINPALQERISNAIGYKMDRAITLHGIGSALFFNSMLPIAETMEEKAHFISVMAGEKGDKLNMQRIESEIKGLRESLDQYRSVVERMVSDTEVLQLSKRARQQTQFPDDT